MTFAILDQHGPERSAALLDRFARDLKRAGHEHPVLGRAGRVIGKRVSARREGSLW